MGGTRGDVNEPLRITGTNNLGERHLGLAYFGTRFPTARGHDDARRLLPLFDAVKNDILLQNGIIAEGGLPGVEYVETVQLQTSEECLSERTKVRTIAEASRCDGDDLSARREQTQK